MSKLGTSLSQILATLAISLFAAMAPATCPSQQARPDAKDSKPAPTEKNAAQIELLETKVRFETNGDSRKEVHARVRINNELGARQFARLNFDFNRSFQSVEIPLVRVTHASGGTADILPSAITDNPNPAVVDYPAYHDVRVKSVRILGLQPDDLLEYRVITTTTHHPLAPDFWLDHTFDRSGVVSHEVFELDLPTTRHPNVRINPATPPKAADRVGDGENARVVYSWTRSASEPKSGSRDSDEPHDPDVLLSTGQWEMLSVRLAERLTPGAKPLQSISTYEEQQREVAHRTSVAPEILDKASELTKGAKSNNEKLARLYDFVSQKVATVDLPLGTTAFSARPIPEVLASGYADPEDKFALFAGLAAALKFRASAALTGFCDSAAPAQPMLFKHLIVSAHDGSKSYWLDPSLEVAPFGVIPANSGKCAFILNWQFYEMNSTGQEWQPLRFAPPFPSAQKVSVSAQLVASGDLKAKVDYALRGENELTLRVAFHKTEKAKWKDVAQMLALSDGFRGQIVNVTASDPYATKEPFTVEYEISQPKFVDWSKKTVRIPAILPLPGLPDPPTAAQIAANKPIELGTPLTIDLEATIELPAGATAQSPIGTTVNRDYATFTSKYSVEGNMLHASRSLHFLSSELPASRATDFNAFVHAVQSDQSQLFTVQPAPQK